MHLVSEICIFQYIFKNATNSNNFHQIGQSKFQFHIISDPWRKIFTFEHPEIGGGRPNWSKRGEYRKKPNVRARKIGPFTRMFNLNCHVLNPKVFNSRTPTDKSDDEGFETYEQIGNKLCLSSSYKQQSHVHVTVTRTSDREPNMPIRVGRHKIKIRNRGGVCKLQKFRTLQCGEISGK